MEQEFPPQAVRPREEPLAVWVTWPRGNGLPLLWFRERRRAQRTNGRRAAWLALPIGLALLIGPFAGLPWPVEPQRAHAQQVSQPQIKVDPSIVARAHSQVALPIEISSAEALPKRCFVNLRGLPPSVTLTAGHLITAGSWAVSVADLTTLKANIPVGFSGRADIVIRLIALDGRMLAQARTTLVVEPSVTPNAAVRPEREGSRSASVTPLASEATREERKAPAPASRPEGRSEEEKQRAEHALAKGEEYLARGSILVARQYFQRAADAGLAAAALRMGATYDPIELQRLAASGVLSDRDLAQKWYERARDLGSRDAEERLARLRSN